jgi:hypothetical protein
VCSGRAEKFCLIFISAALLRYENKRLFHGAESFLRCWQSLTYLGTSKHFMELKGLLPCLREPFPFQRMEIKTEHLKPIISIPSIINLICICPTLRMSKIPQFKYEFPHLSTDRAHISSIFLVLCI